ncbi:MAG: tyrosine-type recombinase/integrase [Helicobacteraceae bacterium]|nr:tyrosine-type recombinase/integrase [Helicobacteraceae bacterium]
MASYFIDRDTIFVQGRINGKRVKRSTQKKANKINLNWIKRSDLNEVLLNIIDKKEEVKPKFYSLKEFGMEVLELGAHKRIESVQKDYISAFNNHVLPYFEHYNISDIKTHDIEVWQKKLLRTHSSRTVDRFRYVLGTIIEKAYANDLISKNYHALADKIEKVYKKQIPYSITEVQLMLKESTGWLKMYLHLAFTTGMRVGELLALKKSDIYFDEKVIYLQRSISKGIITEGIQKSNGKVIKNHNRMVIVPNFVLSMLKEHIIGLKKDWLFPSPKTGNPFYDSNSIVKNRFKPLLKKIGVEYKTLKATRHTYISLLRNQGVNKNLIQDIVGHVEDSSVTDAHYTSLEVTDFKINAVNNVFKEVKIG